MFLASGGFMWGSHFVPGLFDAHNIHIFNALFVFTVILAFSLVYRLSLKSIEQELLPTPSVGLKNIVQVAVESLWNLVKSVVPHHSDRYLPLLGGIFIYIFISNLLGLVPGFAPPTGNFSGNLAMGFAVYVYYNAMGIAAVGFKDYMAHFMGPVWWMAPLLLIIELFSHAVRPLTLSLRLFGNINGDHLVLEAFMGIIPVGLPVPILAFGIFVSFMQAFVFTMLSSLYVGMAVESHHHEEHHHDEAHA